MSNHVHLLIRSGPGGIATFMRRILTGHTVTYNRRHSRHGHLFQNRYKSGTFSRRTSSILPSPQISKQPPQERPCPHPMPCSCGPKKLLPFNRKYWPFNGPLTIIEDFLYSAHAQRDHSWVSFRRKVFFANSVHYSCIIGGCVGDRNFQDKK